MNLPALTDILSRKALDALKSTLEVSKNAYFICDSFNYLDIDHYGLQDSKQYNPKQHKVKDRAHRPDKMINGEGENGERVLENMVTVARLPIPEQKKIVLLAAAFLGYPQLQATPKDGIETDMLNMLLAVAEENKLNYKFNEIAKRTMSERECAELWYTQEVDANFWDGTPLQGKRYRLRMRVLSPALGDTLYPIWDEYGDMVGFGRYYETITHDGVKQTKTAYFNIYTAQFYYNYSKVDGAEWVDLGAKQNVIGKIPVIYYSQPTTEWADVQEMIERLESKTSNHADTNDYFDSPIVVASGDVEGFSKKGEQGKVLEAKEGAKVEYLTWNMAPESMKMEIENLRAYIGKYTHTPDLSFDNVKGIGALSGLAMKFFFMDAHLKASDKEALFGPGVQRRNNYLKVALAYIGGDKFNAAIRLQVTPYFEYFLPKDVAGEVQTLVQAVQGGILSVETAVSINPLVVDAVEEMKRINREKEPVVPPNDILPGEPDVVI